MTDEPARILIRATNWVGDAVMSLPAIRAIRERYRGAYLAVLARPWVADLYERESSVDRVIRYTPAAGFHDLAGKLRAASLLRRERFDYAILLQNAFEAAAIARLAGVREVIGYDCDGRGWLLSRAIAKPREGEIRAHERFYYLELLRRAGVIKSLPEVEAIRLEGIEAAKKAGRLSFAQLGLAAPVIGVSPGAAYGTAKRWMPERFAEVASRLSRERCASVALFGSATERSLCEAVAGAIRKQSSNSDVRNVAGETSLKGFMEMAAACLIFLTNDSGAMHIASALAVPTVTVFGATNDLTTGPTGSLARVVREPVSCSPCLLRECPIDHRCMTRVEPSRVLDAARELLAAQRN